MTEQEILDAVDAEIAGVLAALETQQSTYAATHNGRCQQLLRTHSTTPSDGTPAAPTNTTNWPTLPALMVGCLWVDEYQAPDGDGWALQAEVYINGHQWGWGLNFGPSSEDYRTMDWYDWSS
jgi:hypothetical protein